MKTSDLIKSTTLAAVLAVAMAGPASAQGGPGAGQGGMRFSQTNTPGWTLMSAEERTAHQTKMRAVTSYDECKQLQEAQHQAMQARATEKGVTLNTPRQNSCERMKARGWIK
jgi:TolA-binding protein